MPALAFLIVYVVLLLCLPARLIVGPLGAPGTPANLWGMAALLWWCCATVGGQNPVKGLNPVRILAALLTVAVLAAYANGMASGWYAPLSVREETSDLWTLVQPTLGEVATAMASSADRGLFALAGWMGIVLMTAEGLRSWQDLDRLVTWIVWLGSGVAVLGIIQFFTGFDIAGLFTVPGLTANADFGAVDTRSVLNRPASTAGHPIEFGVVLGGLFPLAVHHACQRRGSSWAWFPTVVIFVGCAMSVSRSAVLVAGLAFIVLLFGWPPAWRRRALWIAPLAVIGMRLLVPGLVGTVLSLFTNLFNDNSTAGRTGDYGVAFDVFSHHMWFGRGLFTFVPRYYRILDNQYLMLMLELGLVGLLAALTAYVLGITSARHAFRHAATARDRNLGLSLSASIAGLTVGLLTFDAWSYAMTTGCTFLLIGMAGAAWLLSRADRREAARAELEAAHLEGPAPGREEAVT